jgi:hypothetical protein
LASTHDVEFAAYKIERWNHVCNSIPPKFSILRMDQNAGNFLKKKFLKISHLVLSSMVAEVKEVTRR